MYIVPFNNYKVFTDITVVEINILRDDDNKDANWEKLGNPTNIKYANSPFNYEKAANGEITLTGFETGKSTALERNFDITENSIIEEELPIKRIGENAFENVGERDCYAEYYNKLRCWSICK